MSNIIYLLSTVSKKSTVQTVFHTNAFREDISINRLKVDLGSSFEQIWWDPEYAKINAKILKVFNIIIYGCGGRLGYIYIKRANDVGVVSLWFNFPFNSYGHVKTVS